MKPIATRAYRNDKTGERIVASVYAPRRVSSDEWACLFVIRGLPEAQRHDVTGADSLEALIIAMQGIRFYLARSGLPIRMLDGEVGDFGIYRSLAGFDVAMTEHLESVVDREVTKLVRAKVRERRASAKAKVKAKDTATIGKVQASGRPKRGR